RLGGPLSGAPMDGHVGSAARSSQAFPVIPRAGTAGRLYDGSRSSEHGATRLKADSVRGGIKSNFHRSGGTPASSIIELAATGDIPCQGYSGGCQRGGDYGTAANYNTSGRFLCRQCAVKYI